MPTSTRVYEDEIETLARYEGSNTYTMLENTFHATLENLDLSKQWTIHVAANLANGNTATVSVQGKLVTLTANNLTTDFDINPLEPVIIHIEAFNSLQISITVESLDSFYAAKRFALLAYLPRKEYETAVLGKAVLGSFQLASTSRPTKGFILGTSALGTASLAGEVNTHAWQNIISSGTAIKVSRGIDFNGFTSKADIGTLSFTAYNALIPATSNLVRGTQIKLIDALTRRPLYTGVIDSMKITPAKNGTYTIQFECVDKLAQIAEITKYQSTREVGATWTSAITEMLKNNFDYQINTTRENTPLIGSIVKEASLIDYLDIFCATVGASWYANKAGKLIFTDQLEKTPHLYITDTNTTNSQLPIVSPVQIEATFDSTTVISTLEAANHSANKDAQGQWQSTQNNVRIENTTLTKNYGKKILNIETCAVNQKSLTAYVQELIENQDISQTIQQAQFTLIDNYNEQEINISEILALEILDPVTIRYRNSETLAHIGRITYQITPNNTTCKLEFVNHRKENQ